MAVDQVPEDGIRPEQHGVLFELYLGSLRHNIEVWREADDGSGPGDDPGAPVGTGVRVAFLPPGTRQFSEYGNASRSWHWYRFRHSWGLETPSDYTAWVAVRWTKFPPRIPIAPPKPRLDFDLVLDSSDGTVDLAVDSEPIVDSVEYLVSTSGWPVGTGTFVDTDANGDVDVADIATLSGGETAYVLVRFYSGTSGGGVLLGTLRHSVTFVAGAGTVPTVQEIRSESATQGTLSLTINDPDSRVTQVRSRTKSGAEAWSAWAVDAGPDPYGPWTVDLVREHISLIEYEVTYTDPVDATSKIIASSVPYDTDSVPDILELVAHVGKYLEPWGVLRTVEIDYEGDSDLASIRYAVSTDDYPSLATTQAGTVVAGRVGLNVEVHPGTSSFADLFISVLGYTGTDGTGTESELYTVKLEGSGDGDPVSSASMILNGEFADLGAYWSTLTGSAVAFTTSPTIVGSGVEVQFTANDQVATIVQTVDEDPDITKAV